EDLLRLDIDHLAGGRIGQSPVEAKRDPARLFAQFDAHHLFGRHHCRIEDVHPLVVGIAEPNLFLIRGQSYAVARASVAFGRALLEARDFDTMEHLPGFQVSDFKSEQIIDIHKTERIIVIDREWTNDVAKRADFPDDLTRLRIYNRQQWRFQSCKISESTIKRHNRVVRAGIEVELLDHPTGQRVHNEPMRAFE